MKPIVSDTILGDAVIKELEDDPDVALRRGVSSICPDAPMMVTRAREDQIRRVDVKRARFVAPGPRIG